MLMLPQFSTPTRKLKSRLAAFRKNEDGSLIIFTLYLFIMMLMIGGLAVDFMRYEVTRSRIANTLDRAILAAADLDQSMDPNLVVQNYFSINGMDQFLNAPTNVQSGLNYRTVNANASATVPMMFANMIGIETMDTMTSATATESVEDIEISLVLDISGSMGWNNKLEAMQEAAKDFVEIIYQQAEYEDISISIIPYSTQVNVGQDLMEEMSIDWHHDESYCINFDGDDFDNAYIRPSRQAEQSGHFDPWYYWGPMEPETNRLHNCRYGSDSRILAFANVEQTLNDHIDGLTAGGNTSIEIGVKWGAALLHHEFQSAITAEIAEGDVSSHFSGRPYDSATGASLKIMVVMTDGINTTEYRFEDFMRTGYSDARLDPETGHFYIRGNEHGDRDGDGDWDEAWFVPHLYHVPSHQRGDFWRDTGDGVDQNPSFLYLHGEDDDHNVIYPGLDGYAYAGNEFVYGYSGPTRIFDYSQDVDIEDSSYDPNGTTISNQTVRLKYDELYDRVSLRYHAWYHVYAQRWNAGDFYYWADDTTWTIGGGTKDSRMSEVCQAARDYNITIYTIGFEVTDASAVVMSDCASSPAHFYRVAGEEIGDAFRSIARQVNELRLIQ